MMNESILRELQELKLDELEEIIRNQNSIPEYQMMTFEERLTHVMHTFYEIKMAKRNQRYLKGAKLRYNASRANLLFLHQRNLPKEIILELLTCNFMLSSRNVLIQGVTGCGKSYLACALADSACNQGKRVKYEICTDLFPRLKLLL